MTLIGTVLLIVGIAIFFALSDIATAINRVADALRKVI